MTTRNNPESNGKTERFNSTLKEIISKLVNNRRDELGAALMAYNNATSSVTGQTPFFRHHCKRVRLPLTKMLYPKETLTRRLAILSDNLQSAHALTEASRRHNRDRLQRKVNEGDLSVGDTVVVKAPRRH